MQTERSIPLALTKMGSIKTWSTPARTERLTPQECKLCGATDIRPWWHCDGFLVSRCTTCKLLQINPQPDPKDVEKRYSTTHGNDYLAYELENEAAFLKLQLLGLQDCHFYDFEEQLRSKLGQDTPKVLDIGCATGALLNWMRDRGWDTCGLEISEPQAQWTRTQRNLDVRVGSPKEAGLPKASFDMIHASHVLEHVNDPISLIQEAAALLKPNGVFFLTTPNASGLQAKMFKGEWRSVIFDHLFLFNIAQLSSLFLQEGLVPNHIQTWGGMAAGRAPAPIKRILDTAAKRFGFGDVMMIRATKVR